MTTAVREEGVELSAEQNRAVRDIFRGRSIEPVSAGTLSRERRDLFADFAGAVLRTPFGTLDCRSLRRT